MRGSETSRARTLQQRYLRSSTNSSRRSSSSGPRTSARQSMLGLTPTGVCVRAQVPPRPGEIRFSKPVRRVNPSQLSEVAFKPSRVRSPPAPAPCALVIASSKAAFAGHAVHRGNRFAARSAGPCTGRAPVGAAQLDTERSRSKDPTHADRGTSTTRRHASSESEDWRQARRAQCSCFVADAGLLSHSTTRA